MGRAKIVVMLGLWAIWKWFDKKHAQTLSRTTLYTTYTGIWGWPWIATGESVAPLRRLFPFAHQAAARRPHHASQRSLQATSTCSIVTPALLQPLHHHHSAHVVVHKLALEAEVVCWVFRAGPTRTHTNALSPPSQPQQPKQAAVQFNTIQYNSACRVPLAVLMPVPSSHKAYNANTVMC